MRQVVFLFFSLVSICHAQINQQDVTRVLTVLSADSMMGRSAGTVYSDKAAAFIASEFRKAGVKDLGTNTGFMQSFQMISSSILESSVMADNIAVDPADVLVFAEDADINWSAGAAEKTWVGKGVNFGQKIFGMTGEKGNRIVFADTSYRRVLGRLRNFPIQRFAGWGNLVVVLTPVDPADWKASVKSRIVSTGFQNVVGMIPGKRTDEYVIFSAHYDHLAPAKSPAGGPGGIDSIFNGANDDASGTTAVIALANHFSRMKKPERTILFVAFTAEESGGYGSRYFSQQLPPEKVVAMFNIEMIGTDSKWGKNSAYITGYEKSDFGKLLQENLKGSVFSFQPDPYPQQNLFYRSDNATLARLGVPAHTISTSKMDSEKFYHTVDDEIETLDMSNMTEIIKSIAVSSKGIVDGVQTPSRVAKLER